MPMVCVRCVARLLAYHVAPIRFTLNLGAPYEPAFHWVEKYDRITQFNPERRSLDFAGFDGNPRHSIRMTGITSVPHRTCIPHDRRDGCSIGLRNVFLVSACRFESWNATRGSAPIRAKFCDYGSCIPESPVVRSISIPRWVLGFRYNWSNRG